jgi:hypothetical protein
VTVECSPRFGPLLATLPKQRVTLQNVSTFAQMLLLGLAHAALSPLVSSLRLDPSSLSNIRVLTFSCLLLLMFFVFRSVVAPPYPEACVLLRRAIDGIYSLPLLVAATTKHEELIAAAMLFYVPAAREAAAKAWRIVCLGRV